MEFIWLRNGAKTVGSIADFTFVFRVTLHVLANLSNFATSYELLMLKFGSSDLELGKRDEKKKIGSEPQNGPRVAKRKIGALQRKYRNSSQLFPIAVTPQVLLHSLHMYTSFDVDFDGDSFGIRVVSVGVHLAEKWCKNCR